MLSLGNAKKNSLQQQKSHKFFITVQDVQGKMAINKVRLCEAIFQATENFKDFLVQ